MPITTTCSNCQSTLKAPEHAAGKRVRCPKCQQLTVVASSQSATPQKNQDDVTDSYVAAAKTAFCTNCAAPVAPKAMACTKCGVPPKVEKHFCHHCGGKTHDKQVICIKCGSAITSGHKPTSGEKHKVVAAILALSLGGIGAHKFYHGSWGWGILYLASVLTLVPLIVSLFEGIMLLCMSDEAYDARYNQQSPQPFRW
jgi:TM2 domain-containing membrane protein YozV